MEPLAKREILEPESSNLPSKNEEISKLNSALQITELETTIAKHVSKLLGINGH